MYDIECIVVGAGVVGLAIARELAIAGREVVVLEAESSKGVHASSRNTSVIHAGINYPPGSLKARFCREGKHRLYRYCIERNIAHKQIGKFIVSDAAAGEAGIDLLRSIQTRARENGLTELYLMTAEDVSRIEPNLLCGGALWSPTSGIIDVHDFMDALLGDIEDHRGAIAFSSPVVSGKIEGGKVCLSIGDKEGAEISCRILINAAGLNAPLVAAGIENRTNGRIPPRLLSRGTYCVLNRPSPFRHLVYPAPHGVHASLDLGGQLRFGPDSEWIDEIDYRLDESRIAPFYEKIRAFWPDLRDGDLAPGWVGIRSKIGRGQTNETDFVIQVSERGMCCMIDLFGIDSPGLTASMAIADEVSRLVTENKD
jgi:L-2-hydroxyglutarate oxidase LhgO